MDDHNIGKQNGNTEFLEATLFEAISHPTRIRLIRILMEKAQRFAELKHSLTITSSGNLQHHLKKLIDLITINDNGKYALTDQGREAFLAIETISTQKGTMMKPSTQVKMMGLIGALVIYIVQLNIAIIFGTVHLLTPIIALAPAAIFGVLQWAGWKVMFQHKQKSFPLNAD